MTIHTEELIRYDQTLHNAARYLGRFAECFATPEPYDEHTTGRWNDGEIVGVDVNGVRATIVTSDLLLKLGDRVVDVSKSATDAVNSAVAALGFDADRFAAGLEFRFPDVAPGPFDKAVMDQWAALRHGADEIIPAVGIGAKTAADVLIWPHNFDSGIFCTFDPNLELYAGFAPADEICDSPYFYNSIYIGNVPLSKAKAKPDLTVGYWPDNWHGAVLPLRGAADVASYLDQAETFLVNTTKVLRQLAST